MNEVLHTDALALLKEQKSNSVPLIITDPPYGIAYHSNYYKEKNPHAPIANDWNFKAAPFLSECSRVLANGGALYLFSRWDITPLWMADIQQSGLKLKTIIIWVKDNWSAGDLTGSFGNQYEQILFIAKGRHLLRGKRWPNVWQCPRVPAKRLLHPAQKPVELIARAINASSNPGDLVIDPYAGSGSTGEACKLTGRSFLLGDVDKRMVSLARRRLALPDDLLQEEQPQEQQPPYVPDVPSLEEWGIHPEQIAELYALLKGNHEQLQQQSLWTDNEGVA